MKEQNVNTWGKEHGLTPATVRRMKLRRLTQEQATRLLGFPAPAAGVLLPYFDVNEKPTDFFRIRFDKYTPAFAEVLGLKPMRYAQAIGSGVHVYLSPQVKWARIIKDISATMIISEGEAKASKACQDGFLAIALGGVASWRGTKQGQRLHPELAQFTLQGREVVICYDSDAVFKPDVRREENAIAAALVSEGARVKIVRLPSGDDGKLDDYLIKHSPEELRTLIGATEEWSLSRVVHELCADFLYVRDGSYVIEIATGRRYTVPQFVNELVANRTVKVGDREVLAGKAFMQSSTRPEVNYEVYEPGQARIIDRRFNRWQGWGSEPRPGDVKPLLDLIEFLVPHSVTREWFMSWLAYPIQHPGAKLPVAVVMVSQQQGVGKSSLADALRAIYGPNNSAVIDQRALESNFNAPLAAKQFIVGEETTGREQRRIADVLKNLITAPTILVNEKYKPQVELANCANFLFNTNHADAFHLEDTDRRFCVIECTKAPRPAEFYQRFRRWLNNDGAAHFFAYLLRRDLSGFNPYAHAPRTEAKELMIAASRSAIAGWVHDLREDPDSVTIDVNSTHRRVLSLHTAAELLTIFGGSSKYTTKAVGMALRAAGFEMACDGRVVRLGGNDNKSARLWITRSSSQIANMRETAVAKLYHAERAARKPEKFTQLQVIKGGR